MHVMLDLETFGQTPGCVIVSIGAVAFDATAITQSFEVQIDARSSQRAGLTLDAETVMWWIGQNDAARQALLAGPPQPLVEALMQFRDWLNATTDSPAAIRLWSKGPSFDAAILSAAYRAVGLMVPWFYRQERCVRTILDLAGVDLADYRADDAIRHHALSDAMTQARAVQAALRRLGPI